MSSEERLAQLERRVRRQTYITLTGALALAGCFIVIQTIGGQPKTVRVRELVVVNATGQEVAYLGQADGEVAPELRLSMKESGEDLDTNCSVSLSPQRGILVRRWRGGIRIGGGPAGGPSVDVFTDDSAAAACMGVSVIHGPRVWLTDSNGTERVELTLPKAP